MDMSGLQSPEILAAQVELEAARETVRVARENTMKKFEAYKALRDEWWVNNLSKFNLDDPEDYMVVAEAGWNGSAGDEIISQHFASWLKEKDTNLSMWGWWESDEDEGIMFPCVQVEMSCEATAEEIDHTVAALVQVNSMISEIVNDYVFRVSCNDDAHNGERYTLDILGDTAAIEIGAPYGQVVSTGTVRECVEYLVKNKPYCSHPRHRNYEEGRYDWQ